MADRRPEAEDSYRAKRQKTDTSNMDPKSNPYLAHMYDVEDEGVSMNGYSTPPKRMNGASSGSPLVKFQRHQTTSAQARKAEDGPTNNPFTGQPLSKQYFSILKTRRDLPVHAQRSVQLQNVFPLTIF